MSHDDQLNDFEISACNALVSIRKLNDAQAVHKLAIFAINHWMEGYKTGVDNHHQILEKVIAKRKSALEGDTND